MRDIGPRVIAFYLPQFHPIPENDQWWGIGFTEWTNVAKARPLFPGHYQPHLPADLGFYDLRIPEVRDAQAEMAKEYGIHGFCYYHYWFNGRRILNRPFDEVLASGRPDFPFCLCWANEDWTRAWDGHSGEILLRQAHSREDDLAHIRALIPAFRDERYIRIGGRPLFLVYHTPLLPNPRRTAELWREEAAKAGVGDLYLARVESHVGGIDPKEIGFDAAVEFAPEWRILGRGKFRRRRYEILVRTRLLSQAYFDHRIYDYDSLVDRMLGKPGPGYSLLRGVTPSWDNTPRKAKGGVIIHGSTPEKYEAWLRAVINETEEKFQGDERLVFVNAWNEWGESNHLEPDRRWGLAYLEATRSAVSLRQIGDAASQIGRYQHVNTSTSLDPVDLTVAIGTFRRRETLARAVASVVSQSLDRPYEILVVDSASEGFGPDDLPCANFNGAARVIQAKQPGAAHARNLALQEARGELVVFLDDDAEAAPGWLLALARAYEKGETAAAGGPILPEFAVPPPRWLEDAYDLIADEFSALDYRMEACILEYPRTLYGPNFSLRRRIAVECGGFREDLGPSPGRWFPGEEVELIHRLQGQGYHVRWVPSAVVRHLVTPDKMTRAFFRRRAYARGFGAALGKLSGPEASLPVDLRMRRIVGAVAYHITLSQLLWLSGRTRAAVAHERAGARWAGILDGRLRGKRAGSGHLQTS